MIRAGLSGWVEVEGSQGGGKGGGQASLAQSLNPRREGGQGHVGAEHQAMGGASSHQTALQSTWSGNNCWELQHGEHRAFDPKAGWGGAELCDRNVTRSLSQRVLVVKNAQTLKGAGLNTTPGSSCPWSGIVGKAGRETSTPARPRLPGWDRLAVSSQGSQARAGGQM